MEQTTVLQPVKKVDRIHFLDILRGIAVLFIFMANLPVFSGYMFMSDEAKAGFSTHGLDQFLEGFMLIFLDGKFYSIFSLLFGIGFAIQYDKAVKSGSSFVSFFSRRMFGLLTIGLIHIFFLWLGDILTLYALLGFVLILFRNNTDKSLLRWAGALILMPIIHLVLMGLTGWLYPIELFDYADRIWAANGYPMSDVYNQGYETADPLFLTTNPSVADFFKMNISQPIVRFAMILYEGRMFKVLAVFLLGLWAGRKILHHNLLMNTAFLKKILLWGVCIGLPMNILRLVLQSVDLPQASSEVLKFSAYAFGVIPLAMAYASGIALWANKGSSFLDFFAAPGRMALSNYLSQTVLAILIFYGIGIGLGGQVGLSTVLGIGILVYIGQIFFSKWWLSRYKFGPIEWLWRQLTYGKTIGLRKELYL